MNKKILRIFADKQEANEDAALITVTASNSMDGCRPGQIMVVDAFGTILGSTIRNNIMQEKVAKAAVASISKGVSQKIKLASLENNSEFFINVHSTNDKLILVGSGPVMHNIYQIAQLVGYHITVIDNRAETLTRERFPEAQALLLGNIVAELKNCAIDANTSIVIASYHHEYDEAALLSVIESPARYIGAMANNRLVTAYYSKLAAMGVGEKYINKLYTPIGLDLGGQKTAEIALAVVAEMQAVKYGCSGGFVIVKQVPKIPERHEELF